MNPEKHINNKKLWQPGQSGNPKGRPPKVKCIPDILRKIGDMTAPDSIQERLKQRLGITGQLTLQHAALLETYLHAAKGSLWALEFIAERTEGKPTQPIDLTTPGPLVAVLTMASTDVKK